MVASEAVKNSNSLGKMHKNNLRGARPAGLLGVGALKRDTTTGGDVRGGVPEIMVAYKDSQGYPEYLVIFTP